MKSCEILKPCGIFSFRIASRLPTSTVKSRRSCENDCGGDWRRDDEVSQESTKMRETSKLSLTKGETHRALH